jgi:hypothetical protein
MKLWNVLLLFSTSLLLPNQGFSGSLKRGADAYVLTYEGGSLSLKQNNTVRAIVFENQVVFAQSGRRFAVPMQNITGISFSSHVHHRFGGAVLGLVPVAHLGNSEDNYVGVTWSQGTQAGGKTAPVEVLFKLSGGEFRDFIAVLERLTGKKAVDTNKTPTVVRYDL